MGREKEKEKITFRERVATSLGVSKEVFLDAPKVTMVGDMELTVENYKSIGEYSGEAISLKCSNVTLWIKGVNLEIVCIASEMIYICGKIRAVEFQNEG